MPRENIFSPVLLMPVRLQVHVLSVLWMEILTVLLSAAPQAVYLIYTERGACHLSTQAASGDITTETKFEGAF